jgi:hypothetical protein
LSKACFETSKFFCSGGCGGQGSLPVALALRSFLGGFSTPFQGSNCTSAHLSVNKTTAKKESRKE